MKPLLSLGLIVQYFMTF